MWNFNKYSIKSLMSYLNVYFFSIKSLSTKLVSILSTIFRHLWSHWVRRVKYDPSTVGRQSFYFYFFHKKSGSPNKTYIPLKFPLLCWFFLKIGFSSDGRTGGQSTGDLILQLRWILNNYLFKYLYIF